MKRGSPLPVLKKKASVKQGEVRDINCKDWGDMTPMDICTRKLANSGGAHKDAARLNEIEEMLRKHGGGSQRFQNQI
jgi:hypothetical protein